MVPSKTIRPSFRTRKLGAVVDATVRDRFDFSRLRVETVSCEEVGVLQTVGDDQRRGVGDIALLDDEVDDGGRGDRVEAACGRVIKNQVGLCNDGTGDRDATAHSPGEFRGKLCESVFKLNEAQGHQEPDYAPRLPARALHGGDRPRCFQQRGNQRVRTPGRTMPMRARSLKRSVSRMRVMSSPKMRIVPVSGTNEAICELHQDGLSSTGRAEDDSGFAAKDTEGDVLQDGFDVEGDGDVFEDDDGLCGLRILLGLRKISGRNVCGHRCLPAEDADHRSTDNEVNDEDEDGRVDDGLSGRFTYTLGTALRGHAEVATDGGDDESGEERLGEALDDVAVLERTV